MSDLERKLEELIAKIDEMDLAEEYGTTLREIATYMVQMTEDYNSLALRVSKLESEAGQKKRKGEQQGGALDFKPGKLYVQIGTSAQFYTDGDEDGDIKDTTFNGAEIEINDGKRSIFHITKTIWESIEGILDDDYHDRPASCFIESLPGGNYLVTARIRDLTESRRVTLNGDTNLYIRFFEKPE